MQETQVALVLPRPIVEVSAVTLPPKFAVPASIKNPLVADIESFKLIKPGYDFFAQACRLRISREDTLFDQLQTLRTQGPTNAVRNEAERLYHQIEQRRYALYTALDAINNLDKYGEQINKNARRFARRNKAWSPYGVPDPTTQPSHQQKLFLQRLDKLDKTLADDPQFKTFIETPDGLHQIWDRMVHQYINPNRQQREMINLLQRKYPVLAVLAKVSIDPQSTDLEVTRKIRAAKTRLQQIFNSGAMSEKEWQTAQSVLDWHLTRWQQKADKRKDQAITAVAKAFGVSETQAARAIVFDDNRLLDDIDLPDVDVSQLQKLMKQANTRAETEMRTDHVIHRLDQLSKPETNLQEPPSGVYSEFQGTESAISEAQLVQTLEQNGLRTSFQARETEYAAEDLRQSIQRLGNRAERQFLYRNKRPLEPIPNTKPPIYEIGLKDMYDFDRPGKFLPRERNITIRYVKDAQGKLVVHSMTIQRRYLDEQRAKEEDKRGLVGGGSHYSIELSMTPIEIRFGTVFERPFRGQYSEQALTIQQDPGSRIPTEIRSTDMRRIQAGQRNRRWEYRYDLENKRRETKSNPTKETGNPAIQGMMEGYVRYFNSLLAS